MRSVLVVVTRQIGDVLLTTPLIRQVKLLWPGVQVDVLGFEGTLGMLQGNPDVRELIATPARPRLIDSLKLTRRIWRRYDLCLIADPGDHAHLIGLMGSHARSGLLPQKSSSNWWKRRLLRHAVPVAGDLGEVHVVAEKLHLLDPWQEGRALAGAPQVIGPASEALPAALQRQLVPGYVVMHTPSMWPYKQWPLEHFKTLITLLAQAGRQVVLTSGPSSGDRACVAAMTDAAPANLLVDAGLLNFKQLAALLRSAALYIGPDTSVSHLAAACGIPVLGIFGPTNPVRWAPWPGSSQEEIVRFHPRALSQTVRHVTLIQADLPCVPCGRAGCEDHRQSRSDCLRAIEPQRVASKALELLGKSQ